MSTPALLCLPILNSYITSFYWIWINFLPWKTHLWSLDLKLESLTSFSLLTDILLLRRHSDSVRVVSSISAVNAKNWFHFINRLLAILWKVQQEGIQTPFEKTRIFVFLQSFLFLLRGLLQEFMKWFFRYLKKLLTFKICIKDPWTKTKGDRIEGGRWGWEERGKVVVGKWRQLCLNNNKKWFKK